MLPLPSQLLYQSGIGTHAGVWLAVRMDVTMCFCILLNIYWTLLRLPMECMHQVNLCIGTATRFTALGFAEKKWWGAPFSLKTTQLQFMNEPVHHQALLVIMLAVARTNQLDTSSKPGKFDPDRSPGYRELFQ